MKTKLWKVIAAVALCAALLAPVAAFAAARYPTETGVVTDDANALSQDMVAALVDYADEVDDDTNVKLHVVLVHFLDGVDAQTYADTLFDRWKLGKKDFLLLGAVGEDSFASASGKDVKEHLSDSGAKSLLFSSGFSELFKSQQYDAAFGKYFVAFNDMLAKQYDEQVSLNGTLAAYKNATVEKESVTAATDTAKDFWKNAVSASSELWNSAMSSITESVDNYNSYREKNDNKPAKGLSSTGWIVLVVIILIIFGQSSPARKARKNYRGGCGCSPLGWIIGGLGLGALFSKHGKH